ncbi:DUF418 domain-containing protein [Bacillus alkalicellulosilyticus]|uniref:DUF418 domain-containing protein n=1 Tax=Alkalihalobacterium alkalicellulosilyticum TaxID=1912214 RepID=UPI000996148B|nr:DUF418 domain-containing protein [Bacillus alkalicellulosilyticus]
MNQSELEPIPLQERIVPLDIIRGLALFGILLANLLYYHEPLFMVMGTGQEGQLWTSTPNVVSQWILDIFVVGKFYPMFSILFGIGFAVFIERIVAKGGPANNFFAKRLFILALFGIIHVFFIWSGDILLGYALTGFFLLLFINAQPKTILKWAFWLFFISHILIGLLTMASVAMLEMLGEELYSSEEIASALSVFQTGSYSEILSYRLSIEIPTVLGNLFFIVPSILPLFLFGYYATKTINLYQIDQHLPWVKAVWNKSLLLSLILCPFFLVVKGNWIGMSNALVIGLDFILAAIFGLALCIFYMTSIVLLYYKGKMFLNVFSYPGKMALSNYLFQSFICVTIFYGYGFGYFAKIGPALGILLAFIIYALQVIVSFYWLKYFRFGPMEWIWKTITYHKAQPLKRR